jgi:hypothetical protein
VELPERTAALKQVPDAIPGAVAARYLALE